MSLQMLSKGDKLCANFCLSIYSEPTFIFTVDESKQAWIVRRFNFSS